jgi:hypothetical protein
MGWQWRDEIFRERGYVQHARELLVARFTHNDRKPRCHFERSALLGRFNQRAALGQRKPDALRARALPFVFDPRGADALQTTAPVL